jgi:hypothetical protein
VPHNYYFWDNFYIFLCKNFQAIFENKIDPMPLNQDLYLSKLDIFTKIVFSTIHKVHIARKKFSFPAFCANWAVVHLYTSFVGCCQQGMSYTKQSLYKYILIVMSMWRNIKTTPQQKNQASDGYTWKTQRRG